MACIHFKRNFTLLLTLRLWVLLTLLGNSNAPLKFVHCLSAAHGGNHARGRSASSPSRRNPEPNAMLAAPRREAAPTAKTADKERTIVILYNKPPNVITSHESQDSRSTVYDDIQSMEGFLPASSSGQEHTFPASGAAFEEATGIRSKLHAIGRLDADTTGLLLLTNDGRLVHHVTNPDAKIEEHERYRSDSSDGGRPTGAITTIHKTYRALIMGCHTDESLEPLRHGVDIGKNYVTKPLPNKDDLQVLEHPNHKSTIVSITIKEGKNRQVRKMFHAIGSGVMKLKRTRIGEHLTLEGVKGN